MTDETDDYKQHLPIEASEISRLLNKYPSALPNWILLCQYAYQFLNRPLVEDSVFDNMLRMYGAHMNLYKDHRYAHLITQDNVNCGSLYNLAVTDYPRGIVMATDSLVAGDWGLWGVKG